MFLTLMLYEKNWMYNKNVKINNYWSISELGMKRLVALSYSLKEEVCLWNHEKREFKSINIDFFKMSFPHSFNTDISLYLILLVN